MMDDIDYNCKKLKLVYQNIEKLTRNIYTATLGDVSKLIYISKSNKLMIIDGSIDFRVKAIKRYRNIVNVKFGVRNVNGNSLGIYHTFAESNDGNIFYFTDTGFMLYGIGNIVQFVTPELTEQYFYKNNTIPYLYI